jgi:hypothetical protein
LCYTDRSNFFDCLNTFEHSLIAVVIIDGMQLIRIVFALALVVRSCAEPIQRAGKAPKVDLGYAVYEGSHDANTSIDIFKG